MLFLIVRDRKKNARKLIVKKLLIMERNENQTLTELIGEDRKSVV